MEIFKHIAEENKKPEEKFSIYFKFDDGEEILFMNDIKISDSLYIELNPTNNKEIYFLCPKTKKKFKMYCKQT